MFKIFHAMTLVAVVFISGCSEPSQNGPSAKSEQVESRYEEGKHYRIVNNINVGALKTPFLVEYFWLGCPHCQNFEKPLQDFKSVNPEVGFIRKHAVLSESWVNDGRIFYALQETKNMAHFAELFDLYKSGINDEDFDAFFTKNNIDKHSFLAVAGNNENVINNMKESYKEMSENEMTSVPSIVVNGKYLIIASEDTNNNEKYFKLVNYLLKK
ncbi:hypothetical protein CJF42_15040 [Pseudoalteromonas sp. NBT06-2]|uniref:thioredoxin domain-containing protein n=1 Tax=Pseudoalteromonas sp. NBT06-2 TaxID=2025950 RepID=UPI000BA65055|nr:thioredoxin domain-containing protein [Pseudoalteromonas sp. NBT06-2]PAJ73579.1 hypothetical protein CJF42_15040 [Pseudoalteromonas sp. NBT06-2]